MRTIVYIDGFNLYYGALKRTPYRCLDLGALCTRLLPRDTILAIKYYTAPVRALPHDPQQPQRQQVYLRALRTTPSLTIHFGHFLVHQVKMPLVEPAGQFAWVIKSEEKGSDVNLATHLLHDGHRDAYDLAVVISNDSDLAEPIRIARNELQKSVGVFTPNREHPSKVLERDATFFKTLRPAAIAASQFQSTLVDAKGTFHKPVGW